MYSKCRLFKFQKLITVRPLYGRYSSSYYYMRKWLVKISIRTKDAAKLGQFIHNYEVVFSLDAWVPFCSGFTLPTDNFFHQLKEKNLLIPKSTKTPRKTPFNLPKNAIKVTPHQKGIPDLLHNCSLHKNG